MSEHKNTNTNTKHVCLQFIFYRCILGGSGFERNTANCECVEATLPEAELCQPGSRYDIETNECLQCSVGTFQPEHGQSRCEPCPEKLTTSSTGATSADDCTCKKTRTKYSCILEIFENSSASVADDTTRCPVGEQLTSNGMCERCPIGTFQERESSEPCRPCPRLHTTQQAGATSHKDCEG